MRFAALVVVCLAVVPARAGTIRISMSPTTEVKDGKLTVVLTVTNGGDEAAQSVLPTLSFRDAQVRGTSHDSLAPTQSIQERLAVPVGQLGTGRWPFRLTVDYTDANQYPFQALQVLAFRLGEAPPAKVSVPEIKAGAISDSGTLEVRIKNLAGTPRTAKVGVLVPEGLEVTRAPADVSLAAWAESPITVPLVNRTALPGSSYPVFATVEYDDGDVHQTLVAQGMVSISAARSFWQANQKVLGGIALALVAVWAAFILMRTLRGHPAA